MRGIELGATAGPQLRVRPRRSYPARLIEVAAPGNYLRLVAAQTTLLPVKMELARSLCSDGAVLQRTPIIAQAGTAPEAANSKRQASHAHSSAVAGRAPRAPS